MPDPALLVETARALADDVLFPSALEVDRTGTLPPAQLTALATAGFYGVAAPLADGGLGADPHLMAALVQTLASGCLSTAFVWIQHHGTVAAVAGAPAVMRDEWLGPLCSGERRAGIGLAGLRSEPGLRVTAVDGGYRLDGVCPWITGWGSITTINVAARDSSDVVHQLLVDATASPSLRAEPHRIVAVVASGTVTVEFAGHVVPADRLLGTRPFADWRSRDADGSTLNGFLAVGLADRCLQLLGPTPLDAELATVGYTLLAATGNGIGPARAAASELALRCAAALAVRTGSRAVLLDQQAQRLVREATFLLVFGSRPGMRDALLGRLGAA